MSDLKASADVSEKDIAGWKKQYGTVGKISTNEDGVRKSSFVRKPTNKEIDFASANLTKGALTQYGISLYNTCLIGGEKFTSEDALRAAGKQMNEMIEDSEMEFEKL